MCVCVCVTVCVHAPQPRFEIARFFVPAASATGRMCVVLASNSLWPILYFNFDSENVLLVNEAYLE